MSSSIDQDERVQHFSASDASPPLEIYRAGIISEIFKYLFNHKIATARALHCFTSSWGGVYKDKDKVFDHDPVSPDIFRA